jgi:hypothetical protein
MTTGGGMRRNAAYDLLVPPSGAKGAAIDAARREVFERLVPASRVNKVTRIVWEVLRCESNRVLR